MKHFLAFGILSFVLISIIGCKKEEPLTPAQMIEGKWTITSQEILTSVVPGDGSYLQFNACSSTCSGVDSKASDTTSGTFIYDMNPEGTSIVIDDTSSNGGSWSGTWDILELTETEFRITGSTLFGNFKVEMSK
jgi:hypothetical protein